MMCCNRRVHVYVNIGGHIPHATVRWLKCMAEDKLEDENGMKNWGAKVNECVGIRWH